MAGVVGKTFLVKCFLNEQYDFFYTGMYKTSAAVQLAVFHDALQRYGGRDIPVFKTWFDAFDALRNYLEGLKKGRIVVFLDEIPWMDTPKSNFLQFLEHLGEHISRPESHWMRKCNDLDA